MYATNINPNTLNDFSQDAFASSHFTSVNGNKVQLFLYAPHVMPDQVLRSFMYQFTPDFTDTLSNMNKTMSLEAAVAPQNLTNIPGGLTAIMPDSEGKVVDTGNWNNVWTFTIILDLMQTSFNGISAPTTRKIASGYIYNEAGTPDIAGNFLLNPNAVLVFTHVSTLNVRQNFNPHARTMDGFMVYTNAMDYAGEAVPAFYKEDMFIGTPGDLVSQKFGNSDGFVDYNKLNLAHVKENSPSRAIDNGLKSPIAQLSKIMTALDAGVDKIGAGDSVRDGLSTTADSFMSPADQAFNTVANNLSSSNLFDITTGLDTSHPITMADLQRLYPNMEVYPFTYRNANTFGWDVAPQAGMNMNGGVNVIMSPKQQFSSLAASVVQCVCAAIGIATVAFSYRWLDGDGMIAGKTESFALSKFDLMVPRNNDVVQQLAARMKDYLSAQLFETIHACCGEFEINCLCDMAGSILVDLRLYNYPDPQDGAYFQTDAKLGGITNPMIGTINVINSNATSLADATQNIIGRTLAQQDFPNSPLYM